MPSRISFNAVTEAFLDESPGGCVEPVGSDFAGSSITVPFGVDGVPAALSTLKTVN